jgi:hypothetical protein
MVTSLAPVCTIRYSGDHESRTDSRNTSVMSRADPFSVCPSVIDRTFDTFWPCIDPSDSFGVSGIKVAERAEPRRDFVKHDSLYDNAF